MKITLFCLLIVTLAIIGCGDNANPADKSTVMVPFVVRAPRDICDYVFVSGSSGQLGTVSVGDDDTLYGKYEGERITAKWRARCTDGTTLYRDTVLVRGMIWSIR